jgi:hyperosmotically inducible periplasmic protein
MRKHPWTTAGLAVAWFTVASLALSIPSVARAATPDVWITTKAKMSLLTDEGVGAATAVNVDTVDGRVTLHGKVTTAKEKDEAEAVVRKITGVKDVANLLQVVPAGAQAIVSASDAAIQRDVEKALADDPALASSDVAVASVHDGVVLLSGTTPTMSAHLRALQVARRVPDVRRVASEIESPGRLTAAELNGVADDQTEGAIGTAAHTVKEAAKGAGAATHDATHAAGATANAASDMWITSAAKLRLIADSTTPALDINVDTTDGVVTLFGMVGSEKAKAAAEADARKVGGVKSVRNELQVVPDREQPRVRASDAALRKAVEESLSEQPFLAAADIEVAVSDGVVRLTGSVPSQIARLTAAVAARATPGVRSVLQDELRVVNESA